jgi:hypothetical protein
MSREAKMKEYLFIITCFMFANRLGWDGSCFTLKRILNKYGLFVWSDSESMGCLFGTIEKSKFDGISVINLNSDYIVSKVKSSVISLLRATTPLELIGDRSVSQEFFMEHVELLYQAICDKLGVKTNSPSDVEYKILECQMLLLIWVDFAKQIAKN